MAKSKALIAADARIAALEAQLALARTCYRELKASIETPTHIAPMSHGRPAAPVVTRYCDHLGRIWIKTRTGNRCVSRLATSASE
jgi:hypothetical protein